MKIDRTTVTHVCRFALVALCLAASPVVAQRSARSTDAAATPQTATPDISVEDVRQRALDLLDALDARPEVDPLSPELERVNEYITLIEDRDPTSPWPLYLRGRLLAAIGRSGDAIDQLMSFTDTGTGRTNWHAHRLLGDLLSREFPQLARGHYIKARELNPNEPSVLYGLSRCAAQLGRREEAIDLARQAVAADGRKAVRYLNQLAAALHAAGRWDDALREAEEALALAQKRAAEAPGDRVPLTALDAQYQLVLTILRSRINDPTHERPEDYIRIAAYLRERTEVAKQLADHEVARVLERGLERFAPDAPVLLLEAYGEALVRIEQTQQAIDVFQQILAKSPDHPTATRWLNRLRGPSDGNPPTEAP